MIRPVHLPILFALAAIPVAACSYARGGGDDQDGVAASGTGGTRTYAVSGFDTVGLGGSGDVEVRVGHAFSVTATGAPATLDKIRVVQSGTSLDLGWKRGTRWSGGDGKVRYVVTMPRIAGASIGGSGTVVVDRVEGEAFEGNIGGSGRLDLRNVRVQRASFAIGGSGNVAAAGRARDLNVSIGGSGKLLLQPLVAETADLTIAGAGSVEANVARTAKVTIVGSGNVTVTGGAKCSVTKMGSGNVRCG